MSTYLIQEEATGCAIASAANIAGLSYKESQKVANALGIFAADSSLWSDTTSIRTLLNKLGFSTGEQIDFKQWDLLPDCALISVNWHIEADKPYWHWATFVRKDNQAYVLDSNAVYQGQAITDLSHIKPKWFIPVSPRRQGNL